jgi:hypothetical protein
VDRPRPGGLGKRAPTAASGKWKNAGANGSAKTKD